MNRYYGGEPAPEGVYLNLANLEFARVGDGSPRLPGNRDSKYLRVPALLAVTAAPVSGLAFIIFLPLVGIIGMVTFLTYKGLKTIQALTGKMKPATTSLQPGTAPAQPSGTARRPAEGDDETPAH